MRKNLPSGGGASPQGPSHIREAVGSGGRPLEREARSFFEPRLGYDLSGVRIHTGGAAAESAKAIDAKAYTLGSSIVFGRGEYRPDSESGRHLIAHELAHVLQRSGESSVPQTSEPVIHRRGNKDAETKPQPFVTLMDKQKARDILVAEVSQSGATDNIAAMNAIETTLNTSSTDKNWKQRLIRLIAAFSLLDADASAMVLKSLTKPANPQQRHLLMRFNKLDRDFREPLLDILRNKKTSKTIDTPAEENESQDTNQNPYAEGSATWIEVQSGVFAYVPESETTLNSVAAYLSGHPELPDGLAKLNDTPRNQPWPAKKPVIVPVEFIDQQRAIGEMSDAMRRSIDSARRANTGNEQHARFVTVRGGSRGPGFYGIAPISTLALSKVVDVLLAVLKKAAYAIAFLAGVVHGFLKSIWDTISGIAKLIYDVLKSIITGEIISDIKKMVGSIKSLSGDQIKESLGEWAAGWSEKLNADSPWTAGHAHGYLTGYVMAEAAMLLLSGGQIGTLKAAFWTSKFGKAVKASAAFTRIEATTAKLASAGGKVGAAIEKLKQTPVGGVVKTVEGAATVVAWTADKVTQVLKLPGKLAEHIVEKAVVNSKRLGKFFERIGELKERAKKWLFGCKSPCVWEPDIVEDIMTRLSNEEIEILAKAGKTATRETVDEYIKRGKKIQKLDPQPTPDTGVTASPRTGSKLPEGYDDMPHPSITNRVNYGEDHHIATRYRKENAKFFKRAGLKIDDDLNLIKDFTDHGQLRGWYDWKNRKYKFNMKGHHPEYNEWVTQTLQRSIPAGLPPEEALRRIQKLTEKLEAIIRANPEVLSHGPAILPAGLRDVTFD